MRQSRYFKFKLTIGPMSDLMALRIDIRTADAHCLVTYLIAFTRGSRRSSMGIGSSRWFIVPLEELAVVFCLGTFPKFTPLVRSLRSHSEQISTDTAVAVPGRRITILIRILSLSQLSVNKGVQRSGDLPSMIIAWSG